MFAIARTPSAPASKLHGATTKGSTFAVSRIGKIPDRVSVDRKTDEVSKRREESMNRRLINLALLAVGMALAIPALNAQPPAETISIDAKAPATAFPHFWEEMFGSGRAELTMRDSYRTDLREVKQITGFQYVRFHAILHDELGVYDEDANGNPVYNFSYVDQIYDGLLANGVKPFVEISFMPKKLASRSRGPHAFWYNKTSRRPRTTPMGRADDRLCPASGRAIRHR